MLSGLRQDVCVFWEQTLYRYRLARLCCDLDQRWVSVCRTASFQP